MNNIIDVLTQLTQLEIDTVIAYEEALTQTDNSEVFRDLKSFHEEHLKHIDALSTMILAKGGLPPERKLDLKGFVLEGITKLRSLTGVEGALAAMELNEKTAEKNYKTAIDDNMDFPNEIMDLIQKHYADCQRHLNYIHITLQKIRLKNDNTL